MMGLTTVLTAVAVLGCHDLMAPLRSLLTPDTANKYLNPAGTVVVYPGSMGGWAFYDDQASVACATVAVCAMVAGPAMFRRPQDGPGFTTWRLNPDSAQSDNWHLDAIAAPFAWGCAIGGASASVAVVDRWFKHAPDLDANASGVQEFYTATLDTLKHEVPHGTWVAGLLAAKLRVGRVCVERPSRICATRQRSVRRGEPTLARTNHLHAADALYMVPIL